MVYRRGDIMDIGRIRGWAWDVANKLIEAESGDTRMLERFLMDLRSSNLPHDFSNVIVDNITVFKRGSIDVGDIPFDLQHFANVTEFKKAKAVIIATFHNNQVLWDRIKNLYNQKLEPDEIAKKTGTKPEIVSKIIEIIKRGERK